MTCRTVQLRVAHAYAIAPLVARENVSLAGTSLYPLPNLLPPDEACVICLAAKNYLFESELVL